MTVSLVTGGAGFIGSHLVDALLAQGHTVRVLDNFSSGSRVNLEHVAERIDLIEGDVTDLDAVRSATKGVELVFHLAARTSNAQTPSDTTAVHHTCATGTLMVLLAAHDAGVRRLIYAGTSNIYGNSGNTARLESDPIHPQSSYAVAKLAGEHYCQVFSQAFGLETVRLRYFTVFGPRQLDDEPYASVIPSFLQAIRAGRSPVIYGDGLQTRDFTYVDDVVQANLLAAEVRRAYGKVYNIASGCPTTLLDLIDCLNELQNCHVKPVYSASRPGDIRFGLADTSRAQTDLGFCPCTDLKEGLRKYIDYYTRQTRPDSATPHQPHLKHFNGKTFPLSFGPT